MGLGSFFYMKDNSTIEFEKSKEIIIKLGQVLCDELENFRPENSFNFVMQTLTMFLNRQIEIIARASNRPQEHILELLTNPIDLKNFIFKENKAH